MEGFGEFSNDIVITNNAIGDGGIFTSNRLGAKDRTIKATSRNSYKNDILRRQALGFFSPKYDYKVYITYMGLTRWFEGKLHKFMLPARNVNKDMTMTLVFYSSNPYLKSYDNFGQDIASIRGGSGFPYLCAKDDSHPKVAQGVTGGIYNFAKKIILENDGDVDTYCECVFEATGDVKNPKLIINGGYVRVIDNMQLGDTIVMDFTKNPPTVKKNGQNYVGHCDRTSSFDEMAFTVGDSVVSFDADNGSNLLKVSLYYNKLYATI